MRIERMERDVSTKSEHASALASAEVLLGGAVDLINDAAAVLDDAGEKRGGQGLKVIATDAEIALERLRRKRFVAEAFVAEVSE